ncbi:MATH domain and coiled-coil domain-containing protein [Pyrus ussuriensis x Pyrus communis]|uniref:MATH domain and coiled-coil domain-containing protein n=1 Tax=Pyrus ussuriensis x Pyrus communis TaxID=2448454 RepID=A0A5N5G618_9ROSA|nr:MATH domain and coiled-coil domain-containing protein [Pyrus ussuriensis x Pyrus communis]
MYPRGKKTVGYLSVYLDVTGSSTLPKGWARYAQFSLSVINQLQSSKSITKELGFASLIPLSKFSDHREGYLVDDICIIEAKVAVHKSEIKLLEDRKSCSVALVEPLDKTIKKQQIRPQVLKRCRPQHVPSSKQVCTEPSDNPANPPIAKEPKDDVPSPPTGELADFRGLGNIDNAFVPLLDEVCSWPPSLIECQRKRSRMFTEWAFTALGRLLLFMKTKKVKDMTADACEELKLLWEELEAFKFDLAWLEPCVQRALGMKKSGKGRRLKRLREDVDALHMDRVLDT